MLGLLEIVVCSGAFVERPDLVDGRAETPLSHQFKDRAQFVFGAHVGAED